MKRRPLVQGLAVAAIATCALSQANAIVLFLDVGGPAAGVQGGPLDNSNPALDIYPTGTASLCLWAIPDTDNDKVVASLGHDIQVGDTAAASLSATQYTLDNPLIGTNARWNGVALAGDLNVTGALVSDQRAVFVPTESPYVGGIGSANLAIDPGYDSNSGAVYLGHLDVTVAPDAVVGSSAELRLAVSPLTIAHVTEGTWVEEPIFFGYTGGGAEPADGTGSDVGATSTTADAIITVSHSPADFDTDGDVDLTDLDTFTGCMTGPEGTPSPPSCQVCDIDTDGDVDVDDFAFFQLMYTG